MGKGGPSSTASHNAHSQLYTQPWGPPKHRGYPVCIQGWEHGLPLPNPALHGAPTPGGSPASAVLPSLPTLAGHASNSRIVWEHTRGRYTCMQCPYSTASREEMTLHIEDHRKNLPPPGRLDADMGTALGGNREDAGGPSRVPTCSHYMGLSSSVHSGC